MTAQRPRVYLAVILPLLVLGAAVPLALVSFYARYHGLHPNDVPVPNELLIGIPAFFLWIPLALLLSNVMLKSIRPLREIAEAYATGAARTGYEASQRQLLRLLGWIASICVPLIVVGWWI